MYDLEERTGVATSQLTETLGALKRAARHLRRAHQVQSEEAYAAGLAQLDEVCERFALALDPVAIQEENRTKLVQLSLALDRLLRSENTHRLAERGTVSLEAVLARMTALVDGWRDSLSKYVADVAIRQAVLTAISRQFAEFAGRRPDPDALPGGRPVLDVESAEADDGSGAAPARRALPRHSDPD
jgi:hypothetical protein